MRARLNVTCAGTLVALSEAAAVVELPTPQAPNRQTTLAIEDDEGDTIYIPARVVRTEPHTQPAASRPAHYVFVEFLDLSCQTATAVQRLIGEPDTIVVQGRAA